MTPPKKDMLTHDDVVEFIETAIQKTQQSERARVMETLTALDKERTQTLLAIESLRHETYKQVQDMRKEIHDERDAICNSHKDAQKNEDDRRTKETDKVFAELEKIRAEMTANHSELEKKIAGNKPNIFTLFGVITVLVSPLLGWIYQIHGDLWSAKIEIARLQEQQDSDNKKWGNLINDARKTDVKPSDIASGTK